eukprot:Gb_33071 [translate_table: standard]
MVLETWLSRMGNHVSINIKTALSLDPKKKGPKTEKSRIGILSFEVANVMSKTVQLWQSLSDQEILRLRNEVIKSEGVMYLVSNDEHYLLGLACVEKLEDLTHVAAAVSRLGKKCQEPALQGFEHVYNDLLNHNIDIRSLEFLVKDMEAKIKKMERYIAATSNLYQELEVLTGLEHSARKMQQQQQQLQNDDANGNGLKDGTLYAFQQKIMWQRQEIKRLRDISLWNRTHDKIIGLLARTVCTIYGRICSVFGSLALDLPQVQVHLPPQLYDAFSALSGPLNPFPRSSSLVARGGYFPSESREIRFASGPLERSPVEANLGRRSGPILNRTRSRKACQNRDPSSVASLQIETTISSFRGSSPGRLFKECLNLNGSYSPKLQNSHVEYGSALASNFKSAESSCNIESRNCETSAMAAVAPSGNGFHPVPQTESILPPSGHLRQVQSSPMYNRNHNVKSQFAPKCKLMHAPPSTLGGAALALHYANVIILVEKLVRFPHLIGHDARDDLYQMLPTSVRVLLRSRLKSYAKNLASTVYDAPLASDWKDALERILGWLAPLAHNMIRWQSEHNFEQQQVVSRTNVLLLQTLYFADQVKTEATITELLVGLNYICRYEQEVRANALLECRSSDDYDDYLEWQL